MTKNEMVAHFILATIKLVEGENQQQEAVTKLLDLSYGQRP